MRSFTSRVLPVLQQWLEHDLLAATPSGRRDARCGRGGRRGGRRGAGAGVGLVRAAAEEMPGRFGLLDLDPGQDGQAPDPTALAEALGSRQGELALRGDRMLMRASPRSTPARTRDGGAWDPAGTVLITAAPEGWARSSPVTWSPSTVSAHCC